MNKKKIAIITARGGSKRIPRKNIKDFCGKPIIQYSIDAAIQTGVFDEIMVSTDDIEIAELSTRLGANVPFMRSKETSTDMSTTADVIEEVLYQYRSKGVEFDECCCIYPTAPFVTGDKLKYGMDLLKKHNAAVPVVAFSFPPQRCFVIENDSLKYKWPEYKTIRSQDLERYYHDCGQFYCIRVKIFLEKHLLVTEDAKAIIMNEMEVQDIDNEEDWQMAELKYQRLNNLVISNTNNKLLDNAGGNQ